MVGHYPQRHHPNTHPNTKPRSPSGIRDPVLFMSQIISLQPGTWCHPATHSVTLWMWLPGSPSNTVSKLFSPQFVLLFFCKAQSTQIRQAYNVYPRTEYKPNDTTRLNSNGTYLGLSHYGNASVYIPILYPRIAPYIPSIGQTVTALASIRARGRTQARCVENGSLYPLSTNGIQRRFIGL